MLYIRDDEYIMKNLSRELSLFMVFILFIAGSMGCATTMALDAAKTRGKVSTQLAFSDDIVAIGQPDAALAKKLGQKQAIAVLGVKHTYLLFKGGTELQSLTQSGLNAKYLTIYASHLPQLYVKDKRLWGRLRINYISPHPVSDAQLTLLKKSGFSLSTQKPKASTSNPQHYMRYIQIKGVLHPPLALPPQYTALSIRRSINFYTSQQIPEHLNLGAVALVPLAMAVDVLLSPVYLGAILVSLTSR